MNFSLGGFLCLKPIVLVGLIVLWNLLMGLGIYLNGGMGQIKSLPAACVVIVASFATTLFCFCVLFVHAVRNRVMQPDHIDSFDKTSFVFVGGIALCLGLVMLLEATGALGPASIPST